MKGKDGTHSQNSTAAELMFLSLVLLDVRFSEGDKES